MLNEQIICADGQTRTKLEIAIQRLKSFEPPEGYFLAFSGGKDSQCIYHLAQMAGVKFDAHYHVTSVDPPELIYFIREHYPDVIWDVPHDEDGKRISMWSLIAKKTDAALAVHEILLQSAERSAWQRTHDGDRRSMG